MNKRHFIVFVSFFTALFCFAGETKVFEGKCLRVVDGDTICVSRGGESVIVRLYGIDAPEKQQEYGGVATAFLTELISGKNVCCKLRAETPDRYGRLIADVYTSTGKNVNRMLVCNSLAWWYKEYAPNDALLARSEEIARSTCTCIWSKKSPVPPWEYRRRKVEKERKVVSSADARRYIVFTTKSGKKYHSAGCRCLSKSKIAITLSLAVSRGLTPCSYCVTPRVLATVKKAPVMEQRLHCKMTKLFGGGSKLLYDFSDADQLIDFDRSDAVRLERSMLVVGAHSQRCDLVLRPVFIGNISVKLRYHVLPTFQDGFSVFIYSRYTWPNGGISRSDAYGGLQFGRDCGEITGMIERKMRMFPLRPVAGKSYRIEMKRFDSGKYLSARIGKTVIASKVRSIPAINFGRVILSFWGPAAIDDFEIVGTLDSDWDERVAKLIQTAVLDVVEYRGHYYKVFWERITWHQATVRCKQMGGYLVCIGDQRENRLVAKLVKGKRVWLGATDEEREGRWCWVNGMQSKYFPWGWSVDNAQEPNNRYGRENYLAMRTDSGWNDAITEPYSCGREQSYGCKGFVCEWDNRPSMAALRGDEVHVTPVVAPKRFNGKVEKRGKGRIILKYDFNTRG